MFTACAQTETETEPSESAPVASQSDESPASEPADEEEYPDKDPNKTTIEISAVRPITGANASFEIYNFGPIYKMWADEVNAAGGIRVEEYGNRQLLVDISKVYDDTSDVGLMVDLLIKNHDGRRCRLRTVTLLDGKPPGRGSHIRRVRLSVNRR